MSCTCVYRNTGYWVHNDKLALRDLDSREALVRLMMVSHNTNRDFGALHWMVCIWCCTGLEAMLNGTFITQSFLSQAIVTSYFEWSLSLLQILPGTNLHKFYHEDLENCCNQSADNYTAVLQRHPKVSCIFCFHIYSFFWQWCIQWHIHCTFISLRSL